MLATQSIENYERFSRYIAYYEILLISFFGFGCLNLKRGEGMFSKLSSKQSKQAGYLAGYFERLFLSIRGCFLKGRSLDVNRCGLLVYGFCCFFPYMVRLWMCKKLKRW